MIFCEPGMYSAWKLRIFIVISFFCASLLFMALLIQNGYADGW